MKSRNVFLLSSLTSFARFFPAFLVCVVWVYGWVYGWGVFLGHGEKKYPRFIRYGSVFYPPFHASSHGDTAIPGKDHSTDPNNPNNPNNPVQAEKMIDREFTWKDGGEIQRKTIFHISEKELKSEIKRFGIHPQMSNPALLQKRGFSIVGRSGNFQDNRMVESVVGMIDYPQIFKRNQTMFHSHTQQLMVSAQLPDGVDPMHSFLYFVQHIPYKVPPQYFEGKFIDAFFVPLVVLAERYGDCDSKAVLLAVFLCTVPGNTEKTGMILIRGKGMAHALLAIKRKPLMGMTSLFDMKKGYYIVLEASSPGWSPGFVSARVEDVLKSGYFTFLDLN